MEKITYIIGAGFSAPLGLPVSNNFLMKSKDLYFKNPIEYSYFKDVFATIEKLSVCKNYFEADLFNVEEILSILEMGSFLEGKKLKNNFIKYIREVIQFYTPKFDLLMERPNNWYSHLFGKMTDVATMYGHFVANLFGGRFQRMELRNARGQLFRYKYTFDIIRNREVEYNIISLNYDLVLERIAEYIKINYECETNLSFARNPEDDNAKSNFLAKLHGSADWDLIIPPTWAKGVNKKIAKIWSKAKELIQESNQIRFIGYSHPKTDTYVQYLLKSAIIKSSHLKNIDVICLDNDNSVEQRFNELINFNYYRFANANVTEYLGKLRDALRYESGSDTVPMLALEEVHDKFMNDKSKY